MKHFYFTSFIAFLFCMNISAQTLMIANFENDGTDKYVSDRFQKVGNGNPYEVVDNPYDTGNNTSGKVLKLTDIVQFGGFHLNLTAGLANANDKITTASQYTGLRLKYRVNDPDAYPQQQAGINPNGMDTYTVAGVWSDFTEDWQTVTFTFGALPANLERIQIQLFKSVWTNAGEPIAGLEIYLDDIELFKAPDPEPAPAFVIANFEGDGTDHYCENRFIAVGSGSTLTVVDNPYATGNNASGKVLQLSDFKQAGGFHIRLSTDHIANEADKITTAVNYDGLMFKYKVNDPDNYASQNAVIKVYDGTESSATGTWSGLTEDWQTVMFKFSDLSPAKSVITSIHVIPYFSDWNSIPGLTMYLDDFEFFKWQDVTGNTLGMIKADGEDVEFFDSKTFEYVYNLPYTHNPQSIPQITYTAGTAGQTVVVTQAENLTGTDEERTATLSVMEGDDVVNEYSVTFNILPELDIYLCLGQSNMSGYGDILASDRVVIEDTYLLTPEENFEPATNPLNKYSTISNGAYARISPAYGFAKALIGKSTNPVGLLVNARNGSSMADWKKGNSSTNLYANTLSRALEAQKWGTIKGVIWHQGESDAWQATAYPNLLKTFVGNLRADLGDINNDIFFVAGEIAYWRASGTSPAFNSMIQTIASFLDNSDWASADGLTGYLPNDTSDPHFNRASAITLGERYAEKVIDKFYQPTDLDEINLDGNPEISYMLDGLNLTVKNCVETASEISVYDVAGRIIFRDKISEQAVFTFPAKGMYILTLSNANTVLSSKICVK